MEGITLRKYKQSDYDFVYECKKIVYKYYVEKYYEIWNEKLQTEMFNKFLKEQKIKIIMLNNERIGFISQSRITLRCVELGNICILPEWQNKGIGTQVIKDFLKKHKRVALRVFRDNPAKALYEKLGFQVYKDNCTHYYMQYGINLVKNN